MSNDERHVPFSLGRDKIVAIAMPAIERFALFARHGSHFVNRGIFAAALALIALGVDFFVFPDLVEDRVLVKTISATDTMNGDLITLGKYRLHTLRVSYGRLIDPEYVKSLGPSANALAVSAYAATATATKAGIGVLADGKNTILSARETARLVGLVQGSPSLPLGSILVFPNKDEAGSLAGIKTILVLRTTYGDSADAKDALRHGLVQLLNESATQSVSGLVLPALTVGIAEKGTPTFNEFFGFLFDALGKSPSPRLVDLTLYSGWPISDLEAAVAALNAEWTARTSDRAGYLPTLHRYQLRLVLIGLAICFIASSRHIVLGVKTTLILTTGFALSLLGSFKTVETITEGLSDAKTVLLLAFTLILAVGFPYFVNWSVKDLFKGEGNGAQ